MYTRVHRRFAPCTLFLIAREQEGHAPVGQVFMGSRLSNVIFEKHLAKPGLACKGTSMWVPQVHASRKDWGTRFGNTLFQKSVAKH